MTAPHARAVGRPEKQEVVQYAPAPAVPPEPKKATGSSLIEFSSDVMPDPNDCVVFGDAPTHCTCPHCERAVITFIDYESSWVTYMLAFVVWFSLGWMAFWVLPLLWPAFKDVVHHCPRCLNVIARKSRISLPTFRSEVMSLKIGSCAVVLARKYVVILFGLLGVILTAYILRSTVHLSAQASSETLPKGPPSLLTWEDFLSECGPRTSLRNRASTTRAFEERFRKRTFKWQGEVMLIREGFDVLFLRAKSVVMVRMYPQRFPRRDAPDVALLFGEDLNNEVALLNPNDWLEFEATMTAHGHRGDPEVMMLWHVRVIPRPSPLSSSAGHMDQHENQATKQVPVPVILQAPTPAPATPAPGPSPPVISKAAEASQEAKATAAGKPDAKVAAPDSKPETKADSSSEASSTSQAPAKVEAESSSEASAKAAESVAETPGKAAESSTEASAKAAESSSEAPAKAAESSSEAPAKAAESSAEAPAKAAESIADTPAKATESSSEAKAASPDENV